MNFEKQISDQEIERSLWLIKNKALIKKIITTILLIIILGLFSFSIIKFINIKIQDGKETGINPTTINFAAIRARNKAQELVIVNQHIVPLTNNQYDLILEINNPNQRIAVSELKYRFKYNNQVGAEKTTFLLPLETKKLIDFNIESKQIIREIDIEIINIHWQRLKSTEIEQFNQPVFTISDQEMHFNHPNDQARNWVEFQAINNSPYNYLNTKFYVSLYLGSKLIAVNEIITDQFYSQEKKNLQVSWFQKIPSYVTLKIEPEINFLDPENYIDPQ